MKLKLFETLYPNTPKTETYYVNPDNGKIFGFKAGNLPWTWRILKNDFSKKLASRIIDAYLEALRKGGYEATEELEIVV